MTVRDIADYWRDREFLPDEDQEVVFRMGNVPLEIKGTTVPEKGQVSVEMAPIGMVHLSWHEIKNLVDAVEKARSDTGRGFFWYFLRHDGIVVRDPGLTDTGYSNLAGHVCRHVDQRRWTVKAEADRLVIEAKEGK